MSDKKSQQAKRIQQYARMIEKQSGKAVRPYRADSYTNMMTRYGTSKDSYEHYKFDAEPVVPDDQLSLFYEGNGLFSKIIDAPAEEALKRGFELDGIKDEEVTTFCYEALDELDWEETFMTAIKWARLFGGSIIVMLINDGGGLEDPLNWRNIKSIDDLRVYDRSVIQPDYSSMFSYDPRNPYSSRGSRLGMPEYYRINSRYGSFTVHESRCLVFQNGTLPENTSNSVYQLWGMPEYVRIHKAIRDTEVAHSSAPRMLDRSVQPVYKMKDLSSLLATEEGESLVLKRLQVIDIARGLLNSLVIDSEGEDYDFRSFQFSGVADVIDAACNFLSAITHIPQSILFGRAPSGMSDTGESDMEKWYSYVERIRKRMIKSNLRYLVSVIFQAGLYTGEVDEVPKIKIKFKPLKVLSDMEQADLDLKKAQIDQAKAQTAQIYVQMEVLDPSEVRLKLADSSEFNINTVLDEYESEEELMAAYLGQEAQAPGQIPQEGDFAQHGSSDKGGPGQVLTRGMLSQYGTEVDVDKHSADPGMTGSAPANAPAVTKLPQDMSAEEKQDIINKDSSTAGVGVLVVKDGKILCGTRHNDSGYGLICGPGGHVENGESYEQAAFRETEEEFGISPKELIPIGIGPLEPESGLRSHIFLCTAFDGEPDCVDMEMTAPKFRSLEELEELKPSLFPPFRDSLDILCACLDFADGGMSAGGGHSDENCTLEDVQTHDGGPGSGNHNHKGVPGQIGGSAPGNGKGSKPKKNREQTLQSIEKMKDAPKMKPKGKFKKSVFPLAQYKEGADQSELLSISIEPIDLDKGNEEIVSIDALETLQFWTDSDKLRGIANSTDDIDDMTPEGQTEGLPIVIKYNDSYILRDGNHRATVAKMQGKTSLRANVIDWNDVKDDPDKEDGGPGSGNHGHKGVPGQVGGSAPGDGTSYRGSSGAKCKEYGKALGSKTKAQLAKQAAKDPEFKKLTDTISLYTQGGYAEQRKLAEKLVDGSFTEEDDFTVGKFVQDNRFMVVKDLYTGQGLETSESSTADGMAQLIGTINESEPYEGKLYRAAQDRNIIKVGGDYEPFEVPEVGQTVQLSAPTSFTTDKAVADKLMMQKMGDRIFYTIDEGASAVDVSKLSPYKQKEMLTCGTYEVVEVQKTPVRNMVFGEPSAAQKKRGIYDHYGSPHYDTYEVEIRLRQVGKVSIGSKEDAKDDLIILTGEQFEDRMVIEETE